MLMEYSFIGVIAVLSVICCVTGDSIWKVDSDGFGPEIENGWDWKTFPEFFGIFFFSMEGIQVMLPVVHEMENQEQGKQLVHWTISTVVALYLVVGVLAISHMAP